MTEERELTVRFPLYVTGTTESKRAMIVIQEAFGVTAHIKRVADQFADEGYLAVAPSLFHRDGSPEVDYEDFPSAMKYLGNLTKEGITNDLDATLNFLNGLGYQRENIGMVGYCMGGGVTFYAASLGRIGAAVSYYGGGVTTGRFGLEPLVDIGPFLKCDWLGLYGDQDQGIPEDQVEALRESAKSSGKKTDIVRYPEGQHGFNCDDRPGVYNEEIAKDAFARTTAFFKETLTDRVSD